MTTFPTPQTSSLGHLASRTILRQVLSANITKTVLPSPFPLVVRGVLIGFCVGLRKKGGSYITVWKEFIVPLRKTTTATTCLGLPPPPPTTCWIGPGATGGGSSGQWRLPHWPGGCWSEQSRFLSFAGLSMFFPTISMVTGGLRPGGLRPGELRPGGLRPWGIEPT